MLLKLETCQEAIVKIQATNAGHGTEMIMEEIKRCGGLQAHGRGRANGALLGWMPEVSDRKASRVVPSLPWSAAEWMVMPHFTEEKRILCTR